MIKNIAIVSLSAGTIGEDFVKHEVEPGVKRLEDYGLNVKFMPNALKGIKYLKEHPEKRAEDLIAAFKDESIDMILCAIGGDDTYRLSPYLFDNDELKKVLNKKVFLGFSDTTTNHMMLAKLGLNTFYGQSFLADICEMDEEMLPYSKKYFEELIKTGTISKITPSEVWYEERTDYSIAALNTKRVAHKNSGFKLLQGSPVFKGKILGGCLDVFYDYFTNERYEDTKEIADKYNLLGDKELWRDKILLLETSEEKMSPEKYRKSLNYLKERGIFDNLRGIIMGKPIDEVYHDEYKEIIKEVVNNKDLPIMTNVSIGHATPRCIIPFGVECVVDCNRQVIEFNND
ncbi:MAG: LD-carboxypeptidase [Erysipelotrichaceae bacterium]|nr:LD-carboxypeptidase [Erysipelotrichaceae bacterium]